MLIERAMCAAERSDYESALECIDRALASDPSSMHARMARLTFLRFVNGTEPADVVHGAKELVEQLDEPTASALEVYGHALYEWANAISEPDAAFEAALTQFTRSIEVGPVIPGAVVGIVAVHVATGNLAEAQQQVDCALDREPLSPQLLTCAADVLWAHDALDSVLEAYQRALELDPRYLDARVGVLGCLIDRGRQDDAQQLLDQLLEEFPDNAQVLRAAERVDTVATTIKQPWIDGQDDPAQVLRVLVDAAVERHRLSSEVADRLREKVAANGSAILRNAFADEQAYLLARENIPRCERTRCCGPSCASVVPRWPAPRSAR